MWISTNLSSNGWCAHSVLTLYRSKVTKKALPRKKGQKTWSALTAHVSNWSAFARKSASGPPISLTTSGGLRPTRLPVLPRLAYPRSSGPFGRLDLPWFFPPWLVEEHLLFLVYFVRRMIMGISTPYADRGRPRCRVISWALSKIPVQALICERPLRPSPAIQKAGRFSLSLRLCWIIWLRLYSHSFL